MVNPFSTVQNITTSRVILNLPSRPLHRLLQNSKLMAADWNQELYNFYQIRATKLYLFYENAWCVFLIIGDFANILVRQLTWSSCFAM